MDVSNIKNQIQSTVARGSIQIRKHSPEILLGAGIIGMVATVIMASKATLKAEEIINQHNDAMDQVEEVKEEFSDKYSKEDAFKDQATIYLQTGLKFAKLYGPTVSIGFLSLAAILASHGLMKDRQVALIAAYNLLKEGYDNYRSRVVEDYGEEVDKNYHLGLKDEIRTETEIDEEGNKKKTKKTTKTSYNHQIKSVYSRFFDESNPMFRSDRLLNKAFLTAQQNYVNDLLQMRGYVFLNEVYERLGFPFTKQGQIVGWILKDPETMKMEGRSGFIDFGIYDVYNDPAREFVNETNPTILLDFNVDGIIFDLI